MKINPLNVSAYLGMLLSAGTAMAVEATHEILFMDSAPFQKYLADWCDEGNDCTSGTEGRFSGSQSDCAHFVAHALLAGGVKVPGTEVSCAKGLLVRAIELRHWSIRHQHGTSTSSRWPIGRPLVPSTWVLSSTSMCGGGLLASMRCIP